MSPDVGLHENVGLIDFESMFPNILVRRKISYEIVSFESKDRASDSQMGLLGALTKDVLERRLYFKHLKKSLPTDGLEWVWCDQRQRALKEILVCIYGYSGCFANRFGNVTVYQEINKIAREELVKSMKIATKKGFQVIYGDNDSLFLKKQDASSEDYKELAREISKRVGLPMALDHHFKFLVLLSQKGYEKQGAPKRYYGRLVDGSDYYRGIELRRRDTPPFLKHFQKKIMEILFAAESSAGVIKNLKKVEEYVLEIRKKISKGKMELDELVISKTLRKDIKDYKVRPPHIIAAKILTQKGVNPRSGDVVDFIYT